MAEKASIRNIAATADDIVTLAKYLEKHEIVTPELVPFVAAAQKVGETLSAVKNEFNQKGAQQFPVETNVGKLLQPMKEASRALEGIKSPVIKALSFGHSSADRVSVAFVTAAVKEIEAGEKLPAKRAESTYRHDVFLGIGLPATLSGAIPAEVHTLKQQRGLKR